MMIIYTLELVHIVVVILDDVSKFTNASLDITLFVVDFVDYPPFIKNHAE
jgi:hypothetical protein